MKQWWVLFKKEWLELLRSYKIFWLPIVFILLGLSQPIVLYYLSDILQMYGDLPAESVISIPNQSSVEVLSATISGQFDQIGLLILVLGLMGMVAAERNSGIMSLILVRPVSYSHYITSKWAAACFITVISLFLGYTGATYYTTILFGKVAIFECITSFLLFALWFVFVATLTLFFSTLFKNTSIVAALSMVILIALKFLTSFIPKWMYWSPARLVEHGIYILQTGSVGEYFIINIVSAVLIIIIILAVTVFYLKQVVLQKSEAS